MFHSLRSSLVAATITAAFSAQNTDVRAQIGECSRWDEVVLGNSFLRADLVGWARTRDSLQRRVDEAAWSTVGLLDHNVELHRIAATAIAGGSWFSASAGLRRGGNTVRLDALTATGTVSYQSTGTVNLGNLPTSLNLNGFTIHLAMRVVHTAVMNLSLISFGGASGSVLSGRMESRPSAWVSASTNVPGLPVIVQQDVRLGDQVFQGQLGAYMGYLSTGYLTYDTSVLRMFLRVAFLSAWLPAALTLIDTSASARHFAPFIP